MILYIAQCCVAQYRAMLTEWTTEMEEVEFHFVVEGPFVYLRSFAYNG